MGHSYFSRKRVINKMHLLWIFASLIIIINGTFGEPQPDYPDDYSSWSRSVVPRPRPQRWLHFTSTLQLSCSVDLYQRRSFKCVVVPKPTKEVSPWKVVRPRRQRWLHFTSTLQLSCSVDLYQRRSFKCIVVPEPTKEVSRWTVVRPEFSVRKDLRKATDINEALAAMTNFIKKAKRWRNSKIKQIVRTYDRFFYRRPKRDPAIRQIRNEINRFKSRGARLIRSVAKTTRRLKLLARING